MGKQLRYLTLLVAVLAVTTFAVLVVNQTAEFVVLVSTINPTLGQIALGTLTALYTLVVAVPLVVFWRLPRSVRPPASEESPEFERYLAQLGRRLAANPHLKGAAVRLDDRAGIEAALKVLDTKAEAILKSTASTVFVSTAISQNGRLDALLVLLAQSRMVWQVAHVYNQRPSLRETINLYANVAATTFAAVQIEDIDLSEQVEVIIGTVFGSSLASAVPGASIVASFMTNALIDGSANALLTLRVGAITKRYCGSLTAEKRSLVRRSASLEATSLLASIMLESASVVSRAILKAASKSMGSAVITPLTEATREALGKASSAVSDAARRAGSGVVTPFSWGHQKARTALAKGRNNK